MHNLNLPIYAPCVDLMRDGVVDQRFFGIVSLFNSKGEVLNYPKIGLENDYPFFLRSLLKPLQASIMADFDTKEHYNFSILNKAGLNENHLKCPIIPPLSPHALLHDKVPKRIHNNCSAKHSMMLAISKQLNFPLETYTDVNHPLQKLILNKIRELSEYENPPLGYDGCTLPF